MNPKKYFFLSLLLLVITSASISMFSFKTKDEPVMLSFPKGSTYEKEWKKTDSLVKLGLTVSALDVVDAIYKKGKTDANAAQLVKSIMYRLRLKQQVQENANFNAIADLNEEIKKSSFPLTPILHSILAELYQQYYTQNRWKFSQRTQVVSVNQEDISTWDLKMLFDQIIKHHLQALINSDSLRRTPLNMYDAILEGATMDSRKLRPALYDFIAHRALDFLMNDEPDVIRPAYKFELTSADYFKPSSEFSKLSISTRDTLSTKYYATRILQDLLAFHSGDTDPSALIDADLKRLNFVKNHSATGMNDSLYLQALLLLEQQFINYPSSAEVSLTIAQVYAEKAKKYDPRRQEDTEPERTDKWLNKKALEKCELALRGFPQSFGARQCQNLEVTIKAKSMSFTLEKVNLVHKPFRAYLSYKNIKKLYARVVSADFEKVNSNHNYYGGANSKELIKEYLNNQALKEWSMDVPDDGDYQTHYLEFKIPELNPGYYIVLLSADPGFEMTDNGIAYDFTWVSDLSFINRRLGDGGFEFHVINRETGTPVKGATANLWYNRYNASSRKYESVKSATYTTDEQGYFMASADANYADFEVELIKDKDHCRTESGLYMYRQTSAEAAMSPHTTLFTDRAIYRPGQTIYFKGILINTNGKRNEILAGHSVTVTFKDVNAQKISSLDLTTNEYGSYSGTFTAPNGSLNGQMIIGDTYGSVTIAVEDYKRPEFEVRFSPLKGSFRLNDSIRIQGTAKAYSGSNVEGAQVKYRVLRKASFPYWWWSCRGTNPSSPQMEIANGVTMTNDTGGYIIKFKAIPDRSIQQASSPTFTYTISADITDINGETHSSETNVSLSERSLNLSVAIPAEINREKEKQFVITTTNTDNVVEAAAGRIEIYKLIQPDKVFRSREWEKPDRFIMRKEEYYSAFPADVYADENNMLKWEKGEKVLEGTFDTDSNKAEKDVSKKDNFSNRFSNKLVIDNLNTWKPGTYLLEAHALDKSGQDVKDIRYFTLYAEKTTDLPVNSPDWFTMIKSEAQPGEKASFCIGSGESDVKVLYELEEQNRITRQEWITLSHEQKRIEIPIEEKYRGNIALHCTFVKNNREYTHSSVITVPWTNKELAISFETFRDKLQPGQKEEWKIKIKDKRGDKLMAEMMATLYDASLDAFRANNWYFDIYTSYYATLPWESSLAFGIRGSQLYSDNRNTARKGSSPSRTYDQLNWFGYNQYNQYHTRYGITASVPAKKAFAGASPAMDETTATLETVNGNTSTALPAAAGVYKPDNGGKNNDEPNESKDKRSDPNQGLTEIKARANFNETAFFYPRLQTDEQGNIILKFTIPEALTRWKMMGLAYTKDLKYGLITKELVTQKELMITPNAPRFLRENDRIEFTAKVTNLSSADLSGTAQLFLYDAITMKEMNPALVSSFTVKKGLSAPLKWDLEIPEGIGAITYKVVAKAGNYSDGEEMILPVLSNRMLVTESIPLYVGSKQTKTFQFEKFISQNAGSATLRNHKLTLEFSANPAWYAIQALPYLMEYPYDCAEQTFSRFYANSIASFIANSSPKIKAVFDSWQSQNPEALLSNLEKNQELKSLVLEETPWVAEAKNETERKNRVALLFNLNHMSNELEHALGKLQKMQLSNGGWPWFEGMPDDRYITQHIITGMGHLDHLGVKKMQADPRTWNMVKSGINYSDERIREDYDWIMQHEKNPEEDHMNYEQIQYLYARSYFPIPVSSRNQKSFDYFKRQAHKYWMNKGRYMQGMIALALNRCDDNTTPAQILKSLKENSITSEEMGMYWKENYDGFCWWEAPVESQALMVEVFDEVGHDKKAVDDLKVWLLKSKQTQNWSNTKATTEACYALLLRGADLLSTESQVEIKMGNVIVYTKGPETSSGKITRPEAGTGYFKTSWTGTEIKPEMGNITVSKKDQGISWGALYWQYFEQLDKITRSKTPVQLVKKLFLERNTDAGPVLSLIDTKTALHPGDKIKVRIELRVDRDMQYVHMKDMRASGLEPVNVLSRYKWQDGLGYYESTRDASTNFFIARLPKGSYIFEYPLRVTHNGDFSNGITSIECMYAPEFASHSEGIRIKVGN